MLPCTRCKGDKITTSKGFTASDGTVYPDRTYTCGCCNGAGTFPEMSEDGLVKAVIATKGKNKGKLRASMVSPISTCDDYVNAARAYYVWRLARFHGGVDMRMPMVADMCVRGDPYLKDLDKLADKVAKDYLGTNMAAARAWGRALGLGSHT